MDGRVTSAVAEEGVGLITIDRPDKRNAMSPAMVEQMTAQFLEFDRADSIRVIILTGAGDKAFCAGHDIKDLQTEDLGHLYEEEHMQVFLLPRKTQKPVISAVNGSAYAGGFCLALASDMRLAVPNATFAVPGPRLGVVPIAGQSSRLPRILPSAIANEMVMAGRPLTAARAEHFGFVNALVPREQLLEEAVRLARDIAAMSRFAVQSYKRIAQTTLFQGAEAADAMEYWLAMSAGHGEDVREGLAAFSEKRAPDFASTRAKR